MLYGCQKEDKPDKPDTPKPKNHPTEYVIDMSVLPEFATYDAEQGIFTCPETMSDEVIQGFFLKGTVKDADFLEGQDGNLEVSIQWDIITLAYLWYNPETQSAEPYTKTIQLQRVPLAVNFPASLWDNNSMQLPDKGIVQEWYAMALQMNDGCAVQLHAIEVDGHVVDTGYRFSLPQDYTVKIVAVSLSGQQYNKSYTLHIHPEPAETTDLSTYASVPGLNLDDRKDITNDVAEASYVPGMTAMLVSDFLMHPNRKVVNIHCTEGEWHKGKDWEYLDGFWQNAKKILGGENSPVIQEVIDDTESIRPAEMVTLIQERINNYDGNTFFLLEVNAWDGDSPEFQEFIAQHPHVYLSMSDWPHDDVFENDALSGWAKVATPSLYRDDDGRFYAFSNSNSNVFHNDIPSFLVAGLGTSFSEAAALNSAVYALVAQVLQVLGYDLSQESFNRLFTEHPEFFEDAYYAYKEWGQWQLTDEVVANVLDMKKFIQHSGLFDLNPEISNLQAWGRVPLLKHHDRIQNSDHLVFSKELGIVQWGDGVWYFDYDAFLRQWGNPEDLQDLELISDAIGNFLVGDTATTTYYFTNLTFTVDTPSL